MKLAQRSANSASDGGPETPTAVLRRCTALATRARVELLSTAPPRAGAELRVLLERMRTWEPDRVQDADPTMVVLAAAALQDLVDHLPEAEIAALAGSADAVLSLLHEMMGAGRIAAPA